MKRISTLGCFLVVALLTRGTTGPSIAAQKAGRTGMSLELELSLGRADVVIGEDTSLTFSFTNTSAQDISLPDPEQSMDWPKIRLRNPSLKTEVTYSLADLAEKHSHEFLVRFPPVNTVLPAKKQLTLSSTLLSRLELSAPGKYELTAIMQWSGGQVSSKPVALTVSPLELKSAAFAGAHSGYSPIRYCIWSRARADGSTVFLAFTTFDHHGHPTPTQSTRLLDVDSVAQPVLSVSPNKFPHTSQWVVWMAGDKLTGLEVQQRKAPLPPRTHNLSATGLMLVPPVTVDLKGAEGSRPGRGHVAVWQPGDAESRLLIRTFESDGSLSAGPEFVTDAGQLRWGQSASLATGERRFMLAVERPNQTLLELVRWDGGQTGGNGLRASRWTGTLRGSGMILTDDDSIFGATILETRPSDDDPLLGYSLYRWSVSGVGSFKESPAIRIKAPVNIKFDRAIVELSPAGNIVVLLHSAKDRWFHADGDGVCDPLPESMKRYGEPIGAFWLNQMEPFIVMAGDDTGITYQHLQ